MRGFCDRSFTYHDLVLLKGLLVKASRWNWDNAKGSKRSFLMCVVVLVVGIAIYIKFFCQQKKLLTRINININNALKNTETF
jgi:hypothetical protein